MDDDDIFAEVLRLEEVAFAEGKAEGRKHTEEEVWTQGEEEGRQLGEEVGFYEGFAFVLAAAQDMPVRMGPILTQLQHSIAALKGEDQPWASSLLRDVRTHFKAVCAVLKYSHAFPAPEELF